MHRRSKLAELGDGASTVAHSPRPRRRARVLAGIAGAAAVAMVGSPAVAGPPAVVDEGTYDQVYEVPAEEFFCGVEVTFHEVGTYRVTAFFDRDGGLDHLTGHIGGTTRLSSAHGEIVNRWRQYGVMDPATNEVTWSGNSYNLHVDPGRLLGNTSGHWVTDDDTGEVVSSAGPQLDEEDIAAVCTVLAP